MGQAALEKRPLNGCLFVCSSQILLKDNRHREHANKNKRTATQWITQQTRVWDSPICYDFRDENSKRPDVWFDCETVVVCSLWSRPFDWKPRTNTSFILIILPTKQQLYFIQLLFNRLSLPQLVHGTYGNNQSRLYTQASRGVNKTFFVSPRPRPVFLENSNCGYYQN